MDLKDLIELTNSGGNVALLVSVYFMWKQNDRLIKIETVLGMIAHKHNIEGIDLLKASQ